MQYIPLDSMLKYGSLLDDIQKLETSTIDTSIKNDVLENLNKTKQDTIQEFVRLVEVKNTMEEIVNRYYEGQGEINQIIEREIQNTIQLLLSQDSEMLALDSFINIEKSIREHEIPDTGVTLEQYVLWLSNHIKHFNNIIDTMCKVDEKIASAMQHTGIIYYDYDNNGKNNNGKNIDYLGSEYIQNDGKLLYEGKIIWDVNDFMHLQKWYIQNDGKLIFEGKIIDSVKNFEELNNPTNVPNKDGYIQNNWTLYYEGEKIEYYWEKKIDESWKIIINKECFKPLGSWYASHGKVLLYKGKEIGIYNEYAQNFWHYGLWYIKSNWELFCNGNKISGIWTHDKLIFCNPEYDGYVISNNQLIYKWKVICKINNFKSLFGWYAINDGKLLFEWNIVGNAKKYKLLSPINSFYAINDEKLLYQWKVIIEKVNNSFKYINTCWTPFDGRNETERFIWFIMDNMIYVDGKVIWIAKDASRKRTEPNTTPPASQVSVSNYN